MLTHVASLLTRLIYYIFRNPKTCIHEWGYARGRSPGWYPRGDRKYRPRHSCVRRVCLKCRKEQEINYFGSIFKHKGDTYFTDPQWMDGHTGKKDLL